MPLFAATLDDRLGGTSESISNMLRIGDESRANVLELADPLGFPAGGPSNRARTSLRSSSNIDSNDICLAILANAVDTLRCRSSVSI
jgi:hypothetical protein